MLVEFVQVLPDTAFDRGPTDERCFARGREEAARLIREYLTELGEDLSFQNLDYELRDLPGEYVPPLGAMFVGWWGDIPATVGALRPGPRETDAELKRIYVPPRFRHQGIGRATVLMLLDAAKSLGYARAVLDTLDRLSPANHIYLTSGFRPIPAYNDNPLEGVRYFGRELT